MIILTLRQINDALFNADDQGLVSLPFATVPYFDKSGVALVSAGEWAACHWNPPISPLNQETEPDPDASPKPTYEHLLAWYALLTKLTTNDVLVRIDEAATQAISEAYGVSSRKKEVNMRLAGEATPAQDAERRRLIARCHAVEDEIAAATTEAELQAIQAKIDDGTWKTAP